MTTPQQRSNDTRHDKGPLSGKIGVISGGVRGIGAAVARNLASKGCSLILGYQTSSSDGAATALAQELRGSYGVEVLTVKSDITSEHGCNEIISVAKAKLQKSGKFQIDIIVNNAATAILAPLGSIKSEDVQKIWTVNVLGPILLTQACMEWLPHDRSGRIVNVSSIGAGIGLPLQTAYAASKGGLEAMTRVWARELSERATVNVINPGPTMTDMYLSQPIEVKQALASWNPVTPLCAVTKYDDEDIQKLGTQLGGRAAYDWEVAGVVGMLCSEDSRWTTGSVISANGGLRFSY